MEPFGVYTCFRVTLHKMEKLITCKVLFLLVASCRTHTGHWWWALAPTGPVLGWVRGVGSAGGPVRACGLDV